MQCSGAECQHLLQAWGHVKHMKDPVCSHSFPPQAQIFFWLPNLLTYSPFSLRCQVERGKPLLSIGLFSSSQGSRHFSPQNMFLIAFHSWWLTQQTHYIINVISQYCSIRGFMEANREAVGYFPGACWMEGNWMKICTADPLWAKSCRGQEDVQMELGKRNAPQAKWT